MAEDQQERHAAEGISFTSLSDRDQEIRELRQQVQDLTGVLEAFSLTQRQNTKHELTGTLNTGKVGKTDGGTIRDGLKLLLWGAGGTMRNYRGILGKIWIDGLLSLVIPRTSRVSWVLCKLSDVEEGRSEVEDDHRSPCGETGYQGHELFGLDGASMRGRKDLHGSTSATRCCGVNLEGLGCQGRLDPGGRVQTPLAKGTVQRGKRQGRVSATTHDKKVGADRGGLRSRSGHHADDHLEHSAEGRREVDKTVRTEPQHTFEWQHGARRRCESTQHVGRGKSGRHHQGSCETCRALLHGNWKIQ